MTTESRVYHENFTIRASEVNLEGEATLPAICSLLQEVAGNHALRLNFDISQLHQQHLTWVLHRMNIIMDRYPKWRENITIETWPAAGDSLRAYRDYEIRDSDNNTIGKCLSYWMMINTKTRRPSRMPQEILEMRSAEKEHVIEVKTNRLQALQKPASKNIFTVRNSDLDMNAHVNNARYVEWMLEALPQKHNKKVREIDIVFLKECYYGDVITSQAEIVDTHNTKHQLDDQSNNVIAMANITTT